MTENAKRIKEMLENSLAYIDYPASIDSNEVLAEYLDQQGVIVPKFKTGDIVHGIADCGWVFCSTVIKKPILQHKVNDVIHCGWYYEHQLFHTKEEAEAKLKEYL